MNDTPRTDAFLAEQRKTRPFYGPDEFTTFARTLERELATLRTQLAEARADTEWKTGAPDVAKGAMGTFWCAIRLNSRGDKIWHRFLQYGNAYVMPLGDDCYDAPKSAVPVGDDGEYEWTGWFEHSCDQCDTHWEYTGGEVIAWMRLPKFDAARQGGGA